MLSFYVALMVIGATVVVVGSVSDPIRRSFLSENLVALVVGVIAGPVVLGWVDTGTLGQQPDVLETVAGLVVSLALMEVALRVPVRYLVGQWRVPAVLLGLVTLAMWVTSSLLVHLLIGLPLFVSMIIGGAISPTDPVVAGSVVSGSFAEQHLPARIRHAISAESLANDGVAYPFVLLPILLLTLPTGSAFGHWTLDAVLLHVFAGVALGALLGYAMGRVLRWAEDRETFEDVELLAYTPGLLILVLSISRVLPVNGFLAVVASGVALQVALGRTPEAKERATITAISRIATLAVFVLLGTVLPWQDWLELGWTGLVLVVAVLLFRRMPALMAVRPLLAPDLRTTDAFFIGWFGPRRSPTAESVQSAVGSGRP